MKHIYFYRTKLKQDKKIKCVLLPFSQFVNGAVVQDFIAFQMKSFAGSPMSYFGGILSGNKFSSSLQVLDQKIDVCSLVRALY